MCHILQSVMAVAIEAGIEATIVMFMAMYGFNTLRPKQILGVINHLGVLRSEFNHSLYSFDVVGGQLCPPSRNY